MKMAEFLEKYQDKADAAIAVGCAVLLLASAGLLVNQFRLQKQRTLHCRPFTGMKRRPPRLRP